MIKAQTIILVLFLQWLPSLAQDDVQFGVLTSFDKNLSSYEKDTTASAIYLYEKGDNFFEVRDNSIWLITKYHAKIKILNKDGFDHSNIQIPYYHSEKSTEKINNIKAVTHNGSRTTHVEKRKFFDVTTTDRWSEKRFTFSDIKVGSVLEYSYEAQSPFYFNLTGWKFQSDIPKIYSEYNAKIPGNWLYNRTLIGEIKLDINDATLDRRCFSLPGRSDEAACEVLKYAMNHVPAFNESEAYMLSARNYRSRLEFELSEYQSFFGGTSQYTKSWDDVDREFKSEKNIGRQLRKKNFFEKNVSQDLFTQGSSLEKAENIYDFVKKRFTWNKEYGLWSDNSVKDAFDERVGNVAEINIALINLLNSAGLNANMVLLATRERGLPKRNHPVMSDFNYVVAKVDIDDQSYLLDATNKRMPFGMIPFHCLNYVGRVMDFENDSYWYNILPEAKNEKNIRAQLTIDVKNNKLKGAFEQINWGYFSVDQRDLLNSLTKEKYLDKVEKKMLGDGQITHHEVIEKYSNEKKLLERLKFESQQQTHGSNLYVNPFFTFYFNKNPFTAADRNHPIDFGYTRNYSLSLTLKIPENYKVKTLPDSKNFSLAENGGSIRFECKENQIGSIELFFDFKLSKTQYPSSTYEAIKDMYSKAVALQTQSIIVLEKI